MYNPFSLEGKTILITGASSGIGRTTAIECSKMGASCIITGRNEMRLQETFEQLEGNGHSKIIADLTKENERILLVNKIPQLDGLVNNAGVTQTKAIGFVNQADLDKVFTINTFAPVLLTKEIIKQKKIKRGASIVVTSSLAAIKNVIGESVYAMTKTAIMSFTKSCALELASKKIRANSVHPGMVETEMLSNSILSKEWIESDKKKYPIQRYAKPKEIALAIIYLLSDASAWVTGTQFVIDGGRHLI